MDRRIDTALFAGAARLPESPMHASARLQRVAGGVESLATSGRVESMSFNNHALEVAEASRLALERL
jgi:hypothetical protein